MSSERPKLSIIGTGYLGTTHAVCMVELGYEIVAVDVDPKKIAKLSAGELPFYEPGLDEPLRKHTGNPALRFTTSYEEVAEFADVHFVCVGTPQKKGEYAADLRYVESAFTSLAPHLTRKALVVGKSTVPAGTAAAMEKLMRTLTPSKEPLGRSIGGELTSLDSAAFGVEVSYPARRRAAHRSMSSC